MNERLGLRPIVPLTAVNIGFAIVVSVLATVLTLVFAGFLERNIFLLFLMAVLGAALYGGLWTGMLATFLCGFGVATVVFEPMGVPWISDGTDWIRFSAFIVFGLLIAVLAQLIHALRHRAELRSEEARTGVESFRALFNSVADAIYVGGPLGELISVNATAVALQGYTRDEMLGQPWSAFMDPQLNDLKAIRAAVEAAFAGRPQSYEAWVLHKSGLSFPVEVRLSAARYFGRDVVIAVARDLSERRRLETQLRQSQKMDAIGRLAGGVAHDFNNLLTSIRGYASLMRDRVSHDPTLVEDLGEIERAVELASVVTGQLLAFSRKQEAAPRAVSLNDAIDATESLLRRLLDERVELVFEREAALGLSMLDEGQVEQVVMNLVVNARDAIPGKGRIVIRTRNVEAGTPRLPHVALSVSDDGIGMDEQLRTRIFEPFFTTKEAGHGTGLGLSTVYGIVKQSGGSIEVESTPGAGSTFTIYFPRIDAPAQKRGAPIGPEAMGLRPATEPERVAARAPEPAPSAPAAPVEPEPAVSTGLTILLAEDEDPVRHLVRRVLTRAGYRVIEGANGRVALDAARAHDGPIDALVTDVIMPELTGPELAEQLRAERPELRVLFTSGYNDQGMDGNGVVSGLGIAFLQKPFVPEELTSMLAELLAQDA